MLKRFLLSFVVLVLTVGTVIASETSDKFAQVVPNFAAADLNIRKEAQQSWQTICQGAGKNAALQSEVNKLMTEQLGKDNPVETTVWILRQLGIVGDASVVAAVAKFLDDKEARIRDEAARALANIPGKESAKALRKGGNTNAASALISKEHKAAASKVTNETALPQGIPFASVLEVARWMSEYETYSNDTKAATLNALAVRAEDTQVQDVPRQQRRFLSSPRIQANRNERIENNAKKYAKYAIEGAKSDDANLRKAALLSLAHLGDTDTVPFLVEQVLTGKDKGAATIALTRLVDDGVDAKLLGLLKSEADEQKFVALANVLNGRYCKDIRPILLDRAKAAGTNGRLALLQFAESLSTKADVGDFVDVWALISDKGQKTAAEQIIARLAGGDAAPVVAKLKDRNSDDSLSLLGRVSDPKMLDDIRKLPNAVAAFANWKNAEVADDLFKIAENNDAGENKITALRAFVRVISLPNDQLGIKISLPEQTARLEKVFALASRDEDKQLIIQRAGQIRTVESLRFVLKSFDDEKLQETVCGAILDLAHHTELKRSANDEFVNALDKVLSVTKRNDFKERASRYKSNG
jgi:HEAT repeat protein